MWGGCFALTDEYFIFSCHNALVKALVLARLSTGATLASRWKEFLQLLLKCHLILEFHFCIIYLKRIKLFLNRAQVRNMTL